VVWLTREPRRWCRWLPRAPTSSTRFPAERCCKRSVESRRCRIGCRLPDACNVCLCAGRARSFHRLDGRTGDVRARHDRRARTARRLRRRAPRGCPCSTPHTRCSRAPARGSVPDAPSRAPRARAGWSNNRAEHASTPGPRTRRALRWCSRNVRGRGPTNAPDRNRRHRAVSRTPTVLCAATAIRSRGLLLAPTKRLSRSVASESCEQPAWLPA
jgi:hypothetical protein